MPNHFTMLIHFSSSYIRSASANQKELRNSTTLATTLCEPEFTHEASISSYCKWITTQIIFNSHLLWSWKQMDSTVHGSLAEELLSRLPLRGYITSSSTAGVSRAWVPPMSCADEGPKFSSTAVLIFITVTHFKAVILILTHLNSHLEFDSQINWWTESMRWNKQELAST